MICDKPIRAKVDTEKLRIMLLTVMIGREPGTHFSIRFWYSYIFIMNNKILSLYDTRKTCHQFFLLQNNFCEFHITQQ